MPRKNLQCYGLYKINCKKKPSYKQNILLIFFTKRDKNYEEKNDETENIRKRK